MMLDHHCPYNGEITFTQFILALRLQIFHNIVEKKILTSVYLLTHKRPFSGGESKTFLLLF